MHIIDSLDSLEKAIAIQKAAQKTYREFSQSEVDKIFEAAAKAANEARVTLAEMAVKETGMGVVADKVIKNNFAAETIYNFYKDTKTCGIIERNDEAGEIKIAAPVGLIAAVIPTTNPTSTAIFKCLLAIKSRNAIIISPHPRAKNCTVEAAKIVNEAAKAAGLPDNIIAWVDKANLDMTNTVMREADIILATGGPGMVRAAYSSGKPAIGVGAGNTPAIIDSTADTLKSVASIIESKTFDNGMICASEQSVICLSDIYDNVRKAFEESGCYILSDEEADKVRKTIIINNSVNSKIVGQSADTIAKLSGITVPEHTKILIGEVDSVDISEEFAHEKLSPVLALYKAYSFDDALAKAEHLIEDGGLGHTAAVHINVNETEKLEKFAERLKACRMLVNMPTSQGAIGGVNPALPPSLTLGCGSWGGNSVSENVGVRHLLNIKTLVINKSQEASK